MALSNAVQGARHTSQRITWLDCEGDAQDLTGATITGKKRNTATGVSSAITGTLVAVTPASGIFDWTYSAADVLTAGKFEVQFLATYADTTYDATLIEEWVVERAITV